MFSPESRTRRVPVVVALLMLLGTVGMGCAEKPAEKPAAVAPPAPVVALSSVLAAVREAPAIRSAPTDLTPSVATAGDDMGFDNSRCEAGPAADRMIEPCVFGDRASAFRAVLFGDSHAGMWLPAMIPIAERRHWRLEFYGKPGCPTPQLTVWNEQENRPFTECDRFRDYALGQLRTAPADLVVVTNESFARKLDRGVPITAAQWQTGMAKTLTAMRPLADRVIVLGDTPVLDQSAPECLAAHAENITACFTTRAKATERVWNEADESAARAAGAGYVSVLPWLCSAVCTPVIGNMTVYRNRFHLTGTYSRMLSGVLEKALLKGGPDDTMP
jgi:SGNH domain-containing protein